MKRRVVYYPNPVSYGLCFAIEICGVTLIFPIPKESIDYSKKVKMTLEYEEREDDNAQT